MKTIKFVGMLLVFGLISTGIDAQTKTTLKIKDLQNLAGAQWTGTLFYLDYGKNTKVSIPSNLKVTQSKDNKSSWVFEYQYPDEPKANSKETVTITKDGKIFNSETVIERTNLADKTLRIVTEKSGTDNDNKAFYRFTYLLSKTSFSIKKEVQYEGTTDCFVRNEYSWKR